ncbi:hypothetical protein DNTS_035554 [Danionella cerebrum]|uniref:RalBP1-associated Eps domain-containing protein 2 n=1 Tax=Danionella cerebrum TaxID=2873325 RepID=A0A553NRC2_9TELE|nr:hypothetical protein DNTS_035554 [Danionella translucida]
MNVELRENRLILVSFPCGLSRLLSTGAPQSRRPSLRRRATERPLDCSLEPGVRMMDPGCAAGSGGTFISLSEAEQRCFSGLYSLCLPDSTGKLAAGKVAELFRASQLPGETLHQVMEVCGAKRLGFFGCAQFYLALKLMAAAQAGLPVQLPLPVFVGVTNELERRYGNHLVTNEGQSLLTGPAPLPVGDRAGLGLDKQEAWSPPRSPASSPPRSPSTYRSYPYSAQRNGTEVLLAHDGKASTRPSALQEIISPGRYSLKQQPEQPSITRAQSVEHLVEQPSEDSSDDPWRMTEEQLQYYTLQFRSLQPDLSAHIIGAVAKNFFTKSKLPIPELSHIWELSDMDKDGALTFPEFCTAFHLIVARKNGYPLPETLPSSLKHSFQEPGVSSAPSAQEMSLADLQVTSGPGVSAKQEVRDENRKPEFCPKRVPEVHRKPVQRVSALKPDSPQDLDAGMKTRTRPRSYSSTSIEDAMKKIEEPPTPPPRPQKSHSRASSLDLNKLFQQSAQGARSGWLPPPPPPPPALPPRPPANQVPVHHHLSLSRIGILHSLWAKDSMHREKYSGDGLTGILSFHPVSDKISQKAVQQQYFADFSRFQEEDSVGFNSGLTPQKPMRRKLLPDSQCATPPLASPFSAATLTKSTQRPPLKQKREIQMLIRKNRETNAVLTRLNSELQQQLKSTIFLGGFPKFPLNRINGNICVDVCLHLQHLWFMVRGSHWRTSSTPCGQWPESSCCRLVSCSRHGEDSGSDPLLFLSLPDLLSWASEGLCWKRIGPLNTEQITSFDTRLKDLKKPLGAGLEQHLAESQS